MQTMTHEMYRFGALRANVNEEGEIRRLLFNGDRVHAVKIFGQSRDGAPPAWEVTVFRCHASTVTGRGRSLLAAVQDAAANLVHAANKPKLIRCGICRARVEESRTIPVSPRGGVVCRACFARQRLDGGVGHAS